MRVNRAIWVMFLIVSSGIVFGQKGDVKEFEGQPIYRVGKDVTVPKAIYDPAPNYSREAREKHYEGVSVLRVIVGPDGKAHNIEVQRSLGYGLDEEAIKAVKKWRFEPARKDGEPVPVFVSIEVNFRLR